MKSVLLTLLRDESSQDSVEHALVIPVLVLSVLVFAKSLSNKNRAMFTAVILTPQASLAGILDAIQKVGKERSALLQELRLALTSGKNDRALELARELCGLVVRSETSY